MEHKQYLPHPLLGDYVKSLWTSERDFQPPHDTFELLPDSYIELVFSFGDRQAIEDGESVHDWPRCCVVGLMDSPIRLRARGIVKTVAARFFAWGFFPLFDLDMAQLPNEIWQLNTTWERLGDELAVAVQNDDGESAVAILHDVLIERALAKKLRPNEVQAAARLLFRRKGRGKLRDLQDHTYYSTRQLERKFKQQMGVSPKALARKMRFEQVRDHLTRDPSANLAALAQEYGYSDQAHLTRDFRQLSHKTPAQFASEMVALREAMRALYHVVFFQDPS
jgi:AraC-like DNA-binding protein